MARHKIIAQCLLDLRHVARNALASGTTRGVVRMLADRAVQAGGVFRVMTAQTKLVSGSNQIGRVLIAVHVVAIEAADVAVIHHALREIVALHPVFVRGAVGPIKEIGFP